MEVLLARWVGIHYGYWRHLEVGSMKIERILYPTDFSEASAHALEQAVVIAGSARRADYGAPRLLPEPFGDARAGRIECAQIHCKDRN